jgi:hypothetical protein
LLRCWSCAGAAAPCRTVRTIIAKANGTDRTSQKHLAQVQPDREAALSHKRRKRTGDALPKQAQRVHEIAGDVLKEARGLGRPRAGR